MENRQIRQKAASVWKGSFGALVFMIALLGATMIALSVLTGWGVMTLAGPEAMMIGIDPMTGGFAMPSGMTVGELMDGVLLLVGLGMIASLVLTALYTALYTGWLSGMLRLMRGEKAGPLVIYSRLRHGLKALRLQLWIGLKALLWLLPPLGVGLGVRWLGIAAGMSDAQIAMVLSASLVTMIALAVWLALKYSMSFHVLADQPETGVFACVRRSKTMMKGCKWKLLCMWLHYALTVAAMLAVVVIAVAVEALVVLAVVEAALMLVLAFVVLPRMQLAQAGFYLAHVGSSDDQDTPKRPAAKAKAAPEKTASPEENTRHATGELTLLVIALMALLAGMHRSTLSMTLLYMAVSVIALLLSGLPYGGRMPEEALWQAGGSLRSRSLRAIKSWSVMENHHSC